MKVSVERLAALQVLQVLFISTRLGSDGTRKPRKINVTKLIKCAGVLALRHHRATCATST